MKQDKKIILILASNPKTTPRLRLDEEVREIEEGLLRSKHRDKFEMRSRWALRLRDLRRALLDVEPHIVHFTGHGTEDGLLVDDEIGSAVSISTEALVGLFELFSGQVECVILSACYSESKAASISKHIDFVIGMRKEIKDKAAIEFAVGFYDAIGAGKSVEEAFKFGCNAILQAFPDLPEHLIPVLKKRKGLKKKKKKEMVKIQIVIESTDDILDVQVLADARISTLKNYLINELKLPKTTKDGLPVPYKLYSKTRGEVMDDVKTLRENEFRDNEIFVLKRKKKKIFKQLIIVMLLLILILAAYFVIIIPPSVLPPEMVYIPGGNFLRGTSETEIQELLNDHPGWKPEWFRDETPQREINLDAFYISKYEITNKQYGRFLKDNPNHPRPDYWNVENFNDPDQPVVGVSWNDAVAFCNWFSEKTKMKYRLPTEAEWEKAACGTDDRMFPWGNSMPNIKIANISRPYGKPMAVGHYPGGMNLNYGTMDMIGNVAEWCSDWYDESYYNNIIDTHNPMGPLSGQKKVVRGGSWNDNNFFVLRCADREKYPPDTKKEYFGFRIVRIPED